MPVNSSSRIVAFLLLSSLSCLLSGCGSTPPPPRTGDMIKDEMLSLNEVYITEKTHQQVIAPGGKGRFHDPMTGETCWPAHCCNLPDCPGRSADGTPFLFVEVDKSIVDKPDGTTGFDAAAFKAGSKPSDGYCPKCWEANKLGSLPREQREKWLQNVKLYELPASLARRKELEAELKKWNAEIQIRVNRPLPASVKADQEEKK